MLKKLLCDSPQSLKATIDKTTGFLTAPVVLARTGIQEYLGFELGLTDRAEERIGVLRIPEEVFHPESIKSFVNLVVTDDHPTTLVNTNNVKELQKGTVSEVRSNDEGQLIGLITVTDKDLITKIQKGKTEVSVGYTNDLKKESGVFNGAEYEFIQTNIRANHLAIVDAGRCGPACRLTMDKGCNMITIDGIDFEVQDKQLEQAILKLQKSHDEEKKKLAERFKKKEEEDEEEIKKKEKEKSDAIKEKDAAIAKADALEKSQLSDEKLNALITERALLIADARAILGDKMPEKIDCPQDIKSAVVVHILPDMELKDKSVDYIDAAYDMAVAKAKKATDSIDNLNKDFRDKEGKKITRETARQKYIKDNLHIEEGV